MLAEAKAQGIYSIAYDRLIMNTPNVDYYATFDNTGVGNYQGQYIADTLDLANASGPFNIEFFTGDPGDNNINYFFGGAMDILQPYLDSGVLVCPSGQTDIQQAATVDWSPENAQSRMETLITANGYGPNGTKLDAVMCNNDSTAQGVVNALINAGYTADNIPIVTGQDCDIVSVKNMMAGTQAMSILKDTRILAACIVDMCNALKSGGTPTTNTSYPNDVKDVPTMHNELTLATRDNWREVLIGSEYYTEADLQ